MDQDGVELRTARRRDPDLDLPRPNAVDVPQRGRGSVRDERIGTAPQRSRHRGLPSRRRRACDPEHPWEQPIPVAGANSPGDGGGREPEIHRLRPTDEPELCLGDRPRSPFIGRFCSLSETHCAMKGAGCDGYGVSFSSRSRLITWGFALRSVAVMIAPKRKPRFFLRILSSPARHSSTASALAANTSSTTLLS